MIIDIHQYDYLLEDARIAKHPVSPRDESKLLVFEKAKIHHSRFKNLSGFLPANAHLVLNDTKVIPARLFFKKDTGATIEIFLLNPVLPAEVLPIVMEERESTTWECVIGNKKRWKADEILSQSFQWNGKEFQLKAKLVNPDKNHVQLTWENGIQFSEIVGLTGNIPLPPYLHREIEDADKTDYQTIYSDHEGAVAAPTAGLHFTDEVLNSLTEKGIQKSFLTLHVGAGTFMPVKEDNALNHPMHSEQMVISKSFLEGLLQNHAFVVPVGTTSMRSLESLYWFGVKMIEKRSNPYFLEKLFPYESHQKIGFKESFQAILEFLNQTGEEIFICKTEILIFPGYEFKVCNALITNFHQPLSTLLLLVAAFIGEKEWRKIYENALENDYRFLSFGDSSLLIP